MKLKIILTCLLLTFNYAGQACKCGGPGSVEESYGYAGVVVHGIVESKSLISFEETLSPDKVEEVKRSLSIHQEFFEACLVYEVRLRVIESYKNEVSDIVAILPPVGVLPVALGLNWGRSTLFTDTKEAAYTISF